MSVIYAYNCTWTLIWHHRPKIVDLSEISATPRAFGISATLMFFSYFFHFYLFFQIFIKSTIFSNKNNNWCFWSSWPPKCCWLNWCCWGTSHAKITAPKQKKIRFFEQKIHWKSCIKCQNVKVYHIYYSKFKHMFFSQETTKCKTSTGNGIKIVNIQDFS